MKLKFLLPVLIALLLITGCSKDNNPNDKLPPEQEITYEKTNVSGTNTKSLTGQ